MWIKIQSGAAWGHRVFSTTWIFYLITRACDSGGLGNVSMYRCKQFCWCSLIIFISGWSLQLFQRVLNENVQKKCTDVNLFLYCEFEYIFRDVLDRDSLDTETSSTELGIDNLYSIIVMPIRERIASKRDNILSSIFSKIGLTKPNFFLDPSIIKQTVGSLIVAAKTCRREWT